MPDFLSMNPDQTALVLIDLQKGIINMPVAPYDSSTVVSNAARLAKSFRENNGLVVLVHVGSSANGEDMIDVPTDASLGGGERPDDWMEFAPELGPGNEDVIITKKQWGAFYGTDLDLQLRRRGIDTLVMGGIATNFGVESTARDAYERNYAQIFAEDAMTDMSDEAHQFAVENILKRMGRVRSTDEVIKALS
ncbi:MAG TPA: hydrolase [Balneolaceae bacterium]|nr:hydrolase [Balneolaceae bacterium]